MNKIYDNGYYLLGKVKYILDYADMESIDDEIAMEMLEDLKEYNEESIVCINYSNGMGYLVNAFDENDIIWEVK